MWQQLQTAIDNAKRDELTTATLRMVLTAVSAGTMVWATHFVAMLAYDPGVVMGYDTALTIAGGAKLTVLDFYGEEGVVKALNLEAPGT